ncbi:MAG TPA: dethiobiotin synthase [Candidatus Margulisbacteria bacterium]|nr:MAG: dethiobiotin synthase [Candidatus Margulisbacteria bacterium GWD2_39_127]OGI07777.1 MAG: dethiobiotin synthase [Candidatus Margulisbacteria bacterium GWE2_39_32]HAR63301.1 dethiobiotin synthase [Candidatus Margulisiibacteriota bacterium]HCT85200.1 dethiobiotin synthase [Candidatus Margulisiibacteriota bacterium]
MGKAFFITATDTEVGKTLVGAGLCRAFCKLGLNVGCCKPVATGESISSDAIRLQEASRSTDLMGVINPVLLKYPLAPMSSAELQNETIDIPDLLSRIKRIIQSHDISIIEGVGGIMVPLAENYLVLDLIADLGLQTIVVSPARLGTINHTLMTTTLLQQRGIEVTGIIYNLCLDDDITTDSSYQLINRLAKVPVIAKISYNKAYQKSYDQLANLLDKEINTRKLFETCKPYGL